MSIRNMHYDLKYKLNKLNTNQNKDLIIPEIDMKLNEALTLYVNTLLGATGARKNIGNSTSIPVRVTDELYPLIVNTPTTQLVGSIFNVPQDFLHCLKFNANLKKNSCLNTIRANVYVRQHTDLIETSIMDKSSFNWGEVNVTFDSRGWYFHTDLDYNVEDVSMTYIRQHPYIHNAQDFSPSGYQTIDGQMLTGRVDCELPKYVQSAIVDLAVLIITGEISSSYEAKMTKVKLNN